MRTGVGTITRASLRLQPPTATKALEEAKRAVQDARERACELDREVTEVTRLLVMADVLRGRAFVCTASPSDYKEEVPSYLGEKLAEIVEVWANDRLEALSTTASPDR